uniref:Protein kinase domain-containing protein n=1 Tax=Panagrellus redivivus TaxID=6233 RepID=A0A7E4W7Y7_PANRE
MTTPDEGNTPTTSGDGSEDIVVDNPAEKAVLSAPTSSAMLTASTSTTTSRMLALQPRSDSLPSRPTDERLKIAQLRRPSVSERMLPKFTNNPTDSGLPMPSARFPTSPNVDFVSPNFPHRQSRPNSPSAAGKLPIVPRSRIANIRRESDCSPLESEVAHERYVKAAVQVSTGFEDFSLSDKPADERKRSNAFADPISVNILGSGFGATSGNSPTRSIVDAAKQCYSPATQQLVRANISYSPSPSPTPSSVDSKHQRVMRSMSPIVSRQISKRRYTNSGNVDSDSDSGPLSSKRQCTNPEQSKSNSNCGSPLVKEAPFTLDGGGTSSDASSSNAARTASPMSECSTSSSTFSAPAIRPNKFLLDGVVLPSSSNSSPMRTDGLESDEVSKDGTSTLSSRDQTPFEDAMSTAGPDDVPTPSTTPTGLVRSAGSMSPYVNRFTLPPSPLASAFSIAKPREEQL